MINRTLLAALILAPMVSSPLAFAKDDTSWLTAEYLDKTLKTMIAQSVKQPGFEAVASCAGMSKEEAAKALEKAFRACYDQYLQTADGTQVEQCLDRGPQAALGMSEQQIDSCMAKKGFIDEETHEEALESEVASLRDEMESLQESIDELFDTDERSEADEQRLTQLQDQQDALQEKIAQAEHALWITQMSPTERELTELQEQIGEREPTASEEARLRKLGEKLRQERMAVSQDVLKGLN